MERNDIEEREKRFFLSSKIPSEASWGEVKMHTRKRPVRSRTTQYENGGETKIDVRPEEFMITDRFKQLGLIPLKTEYLDPIYRNGRMISGP